VNERRRRGLSFGSTPVWSSSSLHLFSDILLFAHLTTTFLFLTLLLNLLKIQRKNAITPAVIIPIPKEVGSAAMLHLC
jgi:hypothetical protein